MEVDELQVVEEKKLDCLSSGETMEKENETHVRHSGCTSSLHSSRLLSYWTLTYAMEWAESDLW